VRVNFKSDYLPLDSNRGRADVFESSADSGLFAMVHSRWERAKIIFGHNAMMEYREAIELGAILASIGLLDFAAAYGLLAWLTRGGNPS
jgi:hypothetical protein